MIKGLLRFIIAVIFILSGFVKAVDLVGFSFKMEEYFSPAVFNMPFFEKFALLFSIIVVVLELFLGFMLLLKMKLKFTLSALIALCVFLVSLPSIPPILMWLQIADASEMLLNLHPGRVSLKMWLFLQALFFCLSFTEKISVKRMSTAVAEKNLQENSNTFFFCCVFFGNDLHYGTGNYA